MSPAVRGLFAAFAGLGATAAVIPAVIPAMERALGGSVIAAIPALFAGLLIGVLASAPALKRLRAPHLAAAGALVQAVALAVAAFSASPTAFIAGAAVAGIGFGLTEAAASVATKAASTAGAARILTALTGTVAVVAAVTPLLAALTAASGSPGLVLLAVAAVQLLAAGALLAGARGQSGVPRRDRPVRLRRVSVLALLPIVVALPLYVGVETVFAGWSAVIPAGLLGLDPAAAALGTSLFWALMALGRFLSAAMLRAGIRTQRALIGGVLTAAGLLGVAAWSAAALPALGLAALAAAIVALAPSYALMLGLALDRIDEAEAATAAGVLVACGAAGGTFVPAALLLLTRDPAGAATFLVAALLCLVIAALVAARPHTRAPIHPRTPSGNVLA